MVVMALLGLVERVRRTPVGGLDSSFDHFAKGGICENVVVSFPFCFHFRFTKCHISGCIKFESDFAKVDELNFLCGVGHARLIGDSLFVRKENLTLFEINLPHTSVQ